MSVHQVIFTSCKRGISGVNDGQQIFSHNADFTDYAADSIRRLYTYQVPRLEAGVAMTEEIAATMPQSFTYRKVDDSKSAIALGTYLGRDYMGSAGRFGNFLSHVIVADDGDITNYPCEFYGSIMLRSSMEYEEVNNPDRPDYLPSPTLETGYDINIFSVIDFLSEDDRMSVYINMLYALLSRKNENKKVVILDEPENIIMWIAALEYALPLKAALNISFTTYEYDPNYSLSQICGVIANGTNFSLANKDRFFTFDMQNNDYPEFDTSSEYFDFIRTAFDDSYDILEAFHSFMVNDVGYWGDDLSIITAFIIYKFSLKAITFEQLNSVISFERNHGYISSSPTVAQKILEQKNDLRNTSDDIFFTAIDYVIEQLGASFKDDDIVSIIIHRVVQSFCTSTNESDFSSVYDRANSTLNKLGINLTYKLISNSRTKNDMLNSIISSAGVWK